MNTRRPIYLSRWSSKLAEAYALASNELATLDDRFTRRHRDLLADVEGFIDGAAGAAILNLEEGLHEATVLARAEGLRKPRIFVDETITTKGNLAVTWAPFREGGMNAYFLPLSKEWQTYVERHFGGMMARPNNELVFVHNVEMFRERLSDGDWTKLDVLCLHAVNCMVGKLRRWLSRVADVDYALMFEVLYRPANELGLGKHFEREIPCGYEFTSRREREERNLLKQLGKLSAHFGAPAEQIAAALDDLDDKAVAQRLLGRDKPTFRQVSTVSEARPVIARALELGLVIKGEVTAAELGTEQEDIELADAAFPGGMEDPVHIRLARSEKKRSFVLDRRVRRERLVAALPPERRSELYAGMSPYEAPERELHGYKSVKDAVDAVNRQLADQNRAPISQGDYPTNKRAWKRFSKTFAKELDQARP